MSQSNVFRQMEVGFGIIAILWLLFGFHMPDGTPVSLVNSVIGILNAYVGSLILLLFAGFCHYLAKL